MKNHSDSNGSLLFLIFSNLETWTEVELHTLCPLLLSRFLETNFGILRLPDWPWNWTAPRSCYLNQLSKVMLWELKCMLFSLHQTYVNLLFSTPYGLARTSSLLHGRELTLQHKQWVTMTGNKWCKRPDHNTSWCKYWNRAWNLDSSTSSQTWVTCLWRSAGAARVWLDSLQQSWSVCLFEVYVIKDGDITTQWKHPELCCCWLFPFRLSASSSVEPGGDKLFNALIVWQPFPCP